MKDENNINVLDELNKGCIRIKKIIRKTISRLWKNIRKN